MPLSKPSPENIVAISCINVGVGPGGTTPTLALVTTSAVSTRRLLIISLLAVLLISRCAAVDYKGNVILDTYVAPTMQVSDYRTATTGIEAHHLQSEKSLLGTVSGMTFPSWGYLTLRRARETFLYTCLSGTPYALRTKSLVYEHYVGISCADAAKRANCTR
ncbi:hypothetical protein ONZ45_g12077 [Pleurotus djamor]|nr:hypothetical protein ONZ45_g12077 [Pleurotus djamor]